MHILELLTALLAPHECIQCAAEGSLLCVQCQKHLTPEASCCYRCGKATAGGRTCDVCRRRSRLYAAIRLTAYEGAAKQLVYALKFERKRAAADVIGHMLAPSIRALPRTDEYLLTHLPTATSRVRIRGYDQAQQIARALAVETALPYAALLFRQGHDRQLGQSRQERQRQAARSMYVANPQHVRGRHILLIDDVITTGASVEAAAAALRAAGARRVTAVAFAAA